MRIEETATGLRYSMHQLTREYAAERLAATSQTALERRHAQWVLELVEAAQPHLVLRDLRAWQARLRAEEDNIRRALRWVIDRGAAESGATDLGLRITGALMRFWFYWGASREGVALLQAVLALPGAEIVGLPRARALWSLAGLWWHQARFAESLEAYLEVIAILRSLGVEDERLGDALDDAAWAAHLSGQDLLAVELKEEKWRYPRREQSYRIDGWVGRDVDLALDRLGLHAEDDVAATVLEALEAVREDVDNSDQVLFAARLQESIASVLARLGRIPQALEHERDALRRYREVGHLGQVQVTLLSIGKYELDLGRPDRALRLAVATEREPSAAGWVAGAVISARDWAGEGQLRLAAAALLPADEVARGVREGLAMSTDESIAYALHELPEGTTQTRSPRGRHGLTAREQEVLALVADGRTDGQIAEALVISKKTASVHVTSIKGKLGASSRAEIVSLALRGGLVREG